MTTLLSRQMNGDLAHATRAAQRKLKQLEIENEQRIEEAEALKMTETFRLRPWLGLQEQRQILQRSFSSVKVEFSDLDGLSWCKSPQTRVHSPEQAFVVLTNADLASFGPHETIRASASSRPRPRTSMSSPNLSNRQFSSLPSTSPTLRHAHSTSLASPSLSSTDTIKAILNNHRAIRSRSPIKGLFPSEAYESDSERTIRGSDSDLDDSPRPKKERKKNRISKRAVGAVRGISSPSAAVVSARSAAKRLANAVANRKVANANATASPKAETNAVTPAEVPPQTTAYPAYITYSKPAPPQLSPSQSHAPSCADIPHSAKASIFPPVSKPGNVIAAYTSTREV
ncbi:hypothetical protein DXG01_007782 [Tephrocybe rancida]|nr:hypothetical protein DXG01_007782 [Tephrocybe rancida]